MYPKLIKPFFDFLFAFLFGIVSLPIMILLAVLLVFQNRGAVLFTQLRTGKNAQLFTLYKFKTMLDTADSQGNLLPDNLRITPFGKWIRKYSLDELPQFWNVLCGQMSIVGPRPLLKEYIPLYSKQQIERHSVKPGMTGWAQVNGRNAISWHEKFTLDLYYINHQSFLLDVSIMFKTVWKLLYAKGINTSEQITMEPFNGKN